MHGRWEQVVPEVLDKNKNSTSDGNGVDNFTFFARGTNSYYVSRALSLFLGTSFAAERVVIVKKANCHADSKTMAFANAGARSSQNTLWRKPNLYF